MSAQDAVKVGIDFGTVTTEVAYIWSARHPETLKDIQQWPGTPVQTSCVPSIISFQNRSVSWGYQVNGRSLTYAWTKLLLESSTGRETFDDPILHQMSKASILRSPEVRLPEEIVGEYLKKLRTHILNHLRDLEHFHASRAIEFIFTIPASWSTEAQCSMKRAIQRGGFENCPGQKWYTISEPAAAATAIYSQVQGALQHKDGVLICDIGGGTVDIAAGQITEVDNVVLFEKLATDVGARCGSTAIDARFYLLLAEKLAIAIDQLPSIYSPAGRTLLTWLEGIKSRFTGEERTVDPIHMPLNPQIMDLDLYNPQRRAITPQPHHIKGLFDPVVDQIYKMILLQINAANKEFGNRIVKKVAITGGGGASPYVRRRLEDLLTRTPGMDIEPLIIPDEPQMIVARGAALRGLMGDVTPTRASWYHYAIAARQYLCCPYVTRDQMNTDFSDQIPCHVIFEKNVRYMTGRRPPLTVQMLHFSGESFIKSMTVWRCDSDHAPSHVDERQMLEKATLVCDFSQVGYNECPQGQCNGCPVLIFEVNVDITFSEDSGEATLNATAFGNLVGNTSFKLDRE
ncbi:actin-like ATPase domain-containing protein [Aspergillus steynii IBT 23096]|uniref:Actin-like ATPase domain-containing protein n=1 Tax=Aspergillus steynii IBT 23096 TaxID=1392250 RepID=A0A2I2GB80_9EURO|nr:actin-like ATPase domain-containing protein [Aspergillus steynii IBT 23096]PLB50134.1 actin-like ATPase domain-containing protein [Aspergillus steynii IBT 23096]